MGESHSAEEVIGAFNSVDGIEAFNTVADIGARSAQGTTLLVKVNDESAIGQFYGLCRRMGGERDSTTRNSSLDTVLDSWYTF